MQKIFSNSQDLEKKVKAQYAIPDYIMMENAAEAICKKITEILPPSLNKKILILCGKGNNGGDGYAVARKLQDLFTVKIHSIAEPKAEEAKNQYLMCKQLNIDFISREQFIDECLDSSILLDCLYGTGFHGELTPQDKELITFMNNSNGVKIACDIPSALYFNADYTITMGTLKTELFSDEAKNVCGKIITASLGISSQKFHALTKPAAFLLEPDDIKLPLRKNKSVHKGNFGHALTYAGEKSGAGIIGATAALNFGAGYSSLFKTRNSNLNQFKISPELMTCEDNIPAKVTSVQIGSGLGSFTEEISESFINWFCNTPSPACVIDADLFNYSELKTLLKKLNSVPNSKIVLTPHPKELRNLLSRINYDLSFDSKYEIAEYVYKTFPNTVLVMKGANTFIAAEGKVFICTDGNQSLAKAGSGDVLAGLINALLAQGYSAKDAAITAVMVHAKISSSTEYKNSFFLTPEKLIQSISKLI